jgi:hypothetical protein
MPRSQAKSSSSKSVSRTSSHQQDYMRPMTYTGAVLPRPPTTPIPSPSTQTQASFGQMIKEGFGFGIGSSIAQRIFGPSRPVIIHEKEVNQPKAVNEAVQTSTPSKESMLKPDQQMYNQCILEGGTETVCKQYILE